ncbi:MAG: ATP-dependent 6-phosphofructokinase [bacterium]|nr:ATP-dependent 6-phosphofructokinase [Candidatus Sumerlaeota bacterium]
MKHLPVTNLGVCAARSPQKFSVRKHDDGAHFVADNTRIRFNTEFTPGAPEMDDICFEKAGPRARIFFDPATVRAAIVTCGGLCPGLNSVIRSVVMEFHFNYGVKEVTGIRFGYAGLNPANGYEPVMLEPDRVDEIHNDGGSILGSSRGSEKPEIMVDYLVSRGINILLCVGGDGTQRGANAISKEVARRRLPIAIVGIPKTIDNDIMYVQRSFGYVTAIEVAREVLDSAHNEAKGAPYGIGMVKLMGREAGFIAAGATLASQHVNFCLIPEIPLVIGGPHGFLNFLYKRMVGRQHAVIAVAEGAGQDLFASASGEHDASGNIKFQDIGLFLKSRISEHMASAGLPVNLKYFDPSYHIRSVPANCGDGILCDLLARNAVHAAMAGKTDVLIGLSNEAFIHVPIAEAVARKKRLNTAGDAWRAVLASTGQPEHYSPA